MTECSTCGCVVPVGTGGLTEDMNRLCDGCARLQGYKT